MRLIYHYTGIKMEVCYECRMEYSEHVSDKYIVSPGKKQIVSCLLNFFGLL